MATSLAKALKIHNYSAKAPEVLCGRSWKPRDTKTLVFGVELELECSRQTFSAEELEELKASEVGRRVWQEMVRDLPSYYGYTPTQYNNFFTGRMARLKPMSDVLGVVGTGWLIGKEDSSLDNGIEFVSRPDTLYQHRKNWGKMFEAMPKGLKAQKSCGLHIHVSKHNLNSDAIGQSIALTTFPDFKPLVVALAGRESASYARIFQKTKDRWSTQGQGKYDAINTAPEHTFEWRLFAATTKWKEFERRLEFVASVVGWSREVSLDQSEMWRGWESYTKWVHRDNRESERFLNIGGWLSANPHEPKPPKTKVVTPKSTPTATVTDGVGECRDQNGVYYRSVEELRHVNFNIGTIRDMATASLYYCDCNNCVPIRQNALAQGATIYTY